MTQMKSLTIVSLAIYLLSSANLILAAERWSRQISQELIENPEVINDWIPLTTNNQQQLQQNQFARQAVFSISSTLPPPQPSDNSAVTTASTIGVSSSTPNNDRSSNARVLAYPHNVFGDRSLQNSATQQNPFNFVNPFQFQRYQQQPPTQKASLIPQQQPTSQSFFKFEMPTFSVDGRTQSQPIQTGYQIQHTFGPAPSHSVITSPLFTPQKQIQFPNEYHPQQSQQIQAQQLLRRQPHSESSKSIDSKPSTTANHENLIPQRPDIFGNSPQTFQKPTSFQAPFQNVYKQEHVENAYAPQEPAPVKPPQEEEVQLLYVPYDTLYSPQNEQQLGYNNAKYNLVQQPVNPLQINNFYTQDPLDNREGNYFGSPSSTTTTSTTTTQKPTTSKATYRPITNSNQFLNPKFTSIKTKPKPHQPPLAMFLQKMYGRATAYDIVNILTRDRSVAVLDSPSKSAPQVFIGPSGLQTPPGYTKFELPYLSSFNQNNLDGTLKATPFFVAPLSYKTPFGFSKIVLPEPHVGSIVINKPFQTEDVSYTRGSHTRRPQRPQTTKEEISSTPYVSSTPQNRFPSTTPKLVTRFQSSTPYEEDLYQQQLPEEKPQVSHNDYYSYNNPYQEAIKEVSSPKTIQKQNHLKTRPSAQPAYSQTVRSRPVESSVAEPAYTQTVKPKLSERPSAPAFIERVKARPVEPAFTQTVKPYAHFKPMPSNINNDEYFRAPKISSSSTTLEPETTPPAPSSTRITTTTQPPVTTTPKTYYSEAFEPSRYTQSTRGQQYFETSSAGPTQDPNVFNHKYQSKPLFDDEYRMKAYFRQQNNGQRSRQPTAPETTVRTRFENVQYTPVSLDYDRPSSTPSYFEGSTLRTTTPRITYYTPSSVPSYEDNEQNNVEQAQNEPINKFEPQQELELNTQTIKPKLEFIPSTIQNNIPNNHRQNYDNEVTVYNHDDDEEKSEENEYNKPYNLPSELPPLTPNLPGLVNALKENERLNAIEKETTETLTTTTTTTTSPRTRRPIHRGRRPTAKTSTSSSISYSSSDDYVTRKPITRTRRPYSPPTRNSSSVTSVSSSSSVSTGGTTRTSIRNPNRVRYTPTNEERKQYRSKTRKQGVSSLKKNKDSLDENNLEYQRDVLKQNYPVFKHPTRKPFFTTTTEKPQDVMTVTPSTLGEAFPGLLEPMQIAQQYQHQQFQDNYGPGYFPNEEENNPTEQIRNEIITTAQPPHSPPPTTTPTTTTTIEPLRELTKRPAFVRRTRPSRTTTEAPITTTTESNERFTVRPRRPDGSLPRKVVKVRARTRRPHPVSTTAQPTKEKENIHKVSKFNQDFYSDDYKNNEATFNRKYSNRPKYNLDTQETKWSPALSRSDNFKPVNPKKSEKPIKYDNEPDIVTAGPENQNSKKGTDTYEFNVSAGFGPSLKTYGSVIKSEDEQSKADKKKGGEKTVEPTFEELLEQVMTDLGREVAAKKEAKAAAGEATKIIKEESARQVKSSANDKYTPNNRRGVWKKVRVTQSSSSSDGLEAAESQNIGTQLFNSIYNNDKTSTEKPQPSEESISISTTTDKSLPNIQSTETVSTSATSTSGSDISSSPATEEVATSTSISNSNKNYYSTTSTQQSTSEPQPSELISATSSTIKPLFGNFDGTTTRFFNQDYEEDDSIGDIISRRFDQQQQDDGQQEDDGEHDDEVDDDVDETVVDDLDTQPSLFDEVRSQLKNLFAVQEEEDDYGDVVKPNFQPRKHEYTTIQRVRPSSTSVAPETEIPSLAVEATTSKDTLFHKNLMKNVVYATSTSKEVSHETEICYRGRCVKSTRN